MSNHNETGSGFDELLAIAAAAIRQAYAPYSKFHVGCAVRSEAGNCYTGCNVENASYGLTLCAERNAIAAAVAAEGPALRVAALAVVVDGPASFPPCGACRQVIAEFAPPETPILYAAASSAGRPVHTTIGDLLPHVFRL